MDHKPDNSADAVATADPVRRSSTPAASVRRPRIFLLHGAGHGNVGDNAMMYAVVARLERLIPGCEVVVGKLCDTDDGSLAEGRPRAPSTHFYICRPLPSVIKILRVALTRFRIKPVADALIVASRLSRCGRLLIAARVSTLLGFVPLLNRSGRAAIHAIRDCDAVYCSGGGNLNDIWLLYELMPRVATYRLARIFRKPLFISGQQVGPLTSRLGQWLLKWGAGHAEVFSCRDYAESREFLLRLGFDEDVVVSLGDDATDLAVSSRDRAEEILRSEGVPVGAETLVAVHVRLHNFTDDFHERAALIVARLMDELVERLACRIVFVPVSYSRARAYDGDIGDAFEVFTRMRHRSHAHMVCREHYSPPDMKAVIAACRMLIGFSYHAWIFALTSGIPAFALYYGEYYRMKAEGLFAFYDRMDWIWNLDNLDLSAVLETIHRAIKDDSRIHRDLTRVTADLTTGIEGPVRQLASRLAMR